MALMILVNNQYIGDAFSQLRHKSWNGCTLTDLVFPFFIFIMGASFWFVHTKKGFTCDKSFAFKIVFRSIKIFIVGVLLNWYASFADISELRIMGVLQRIALVYLIGGFLIIWLKTKIKIVIASIFALFLYWGLLYFFGDFTIENNLVRTIDIYLFGESHLYQGYGVPFDPEGVLGTIPSLVSMFMGYFTAFLISQTSKDIVVKLKELFLLGVVCLVLGFIVDIFFPINKPLWSSSYVLLTGGWAMIFWSLISFVVDVKKRTKWITIFMVFGTNAIFAYVLSGVLSKPIYAITIGGESIVNIFSDAASVIFPQKMVTLLWSIIFVGIVWLFTYYFYKRKIFIKL